MLSKDNAERLHKFAAWLRVTSDEATDIVEKVNRFAHLWADGIEQQVKTRGVEDEGPVADDNLTRAQKIEAIRAFVNLGGYGPVKEWFDDTLVDTYPDSYIDKMYGLTVKSQSNADWLERLFKGL